MATPSASNGHAASHASVPTGELVRPPAERREAPYRDSGVYENACPR